MEQNTYNFRNKSVSIIRNRKFVHLPIRFRKIIESNNFRYCTVGNIDNYISCLPVGLEHLNYLLQNSSAKGEIPFLFKQDDLLLFMKTATEVRITKKGTLNIPTRILKKAGISSDIVIVGMKSHFEIWDTQVFLDKRPRNTMAFEEILSLIESNPLEKI